MICIYLLVTLITQFSTQNLYAALDVGASEVSIEFQQLNGVTLGAPVLVEGRLVGVVASITTVEHQHSKQEGLQERYNIKVKIAPGNRSQLRAGTIGLITSPVTPFSSKSETVVELITPTNVKTKVLQHGELIVGYSSLTEFWSAEHARDDLGYSLEVFG
jgi:hypothetical protein